jgi:hypothetical protein
MSLPALPPPDTHCFDEDTGKDCWSHSLEQMQAYGQQCYEKALQDTADSFVERDALAAAAKLALDSAVDVYATCDRYGDGDQKAMESLSKAIEALRQAGVQ